MVDASSARVRVLPTRLKKIIKKKISKLDREIQLLDFHISNCQRIKHDRIRLNIELTGDLKKIGTLTAKRHKLDLERKQLRLKLKGYQ
jgi:hypothetical protein